MFVYKYHAFIYFLRPPPWSGTPRNLSAVICFVPEVENFCIFIYIYTDIPPPPPISCDIYQQVDGGKRMGRGEVELILFGTHVSKNLELGDNIHCHTLLFPSWTIYFILFNFVQLTGRHTMAAKKLMPKQKTAKIEKAVTFFLEEIEQKFEKIWRSN